MTTVVDLFFSFRSPYSYLATPGARRLVQDFAVQLRLRPVLPLAVREPGFFSPDNLKRARYIGMDWVRRAQMLGMAHRWPSPDPIVQDLATYRIAPEQPYIHRLTHLGVEAERRGQGLSFAFEVSHLIFGGTREWHLGDHLALATARAGLDLADMDAAIADPAPHQARGRGQPGGLGRVRPLGRAHLRGQQRAVLWRGPHRHPALAAEPAARLATLNTGMGW